MSRAVNKAKKNKKQHQQNDESEVPELTKEETAIARHLRLSCPNKQGNLVGMKVDFFLGNKLVDCLMESKWGPGTLSPQTSKKNDTPPMLASRQACTSFMQRLMNKQLFYRAVKIYKETGKDGQAASNDSTPSNLRKRKEKKETQPSATPVPDSATPSTPDQQQQQKKKFKLEMHEEQKFYDLNEPYVWVYDPTSTKTYIIGSLLILGAIGICLFPLWPSQVREGVYYLSLAGASFLGAILGLAVLKYILYAVVWIASFGKVQFWFFPNLTEDVGFFESFVPVYTCKLASSSSSSPAVAAAATSKPAVDSETKSNTDETSPLTAESTQEETKSNESSNPDECIGGSGEPILKEISKSTLEICKGNTPKGSPSLAAKLKKKDSITNCEDGFELLDDEDLDKEE